MAKKDFYTVLGVNKSASLDEIKKSYRSLARKHHPDVDTSADAEGKFKEISEAYQILSDPEKRKAYDQFGHAAFDRSAGAGAGAGAGGGNPFGGGFWGNTYSSGGSDFGGFEDPFTIFEQFFGGASSGRARTRNRGDDLYFELTIDFKDSIFGTPKTISIAREVKCPKCQGSGADKGSKVEVCRQCHGSGEVRQVRNSILGQIQTVAVCPTCQGRGKQISNPCGRCHGQGRIREATKQEIRIPAGIHEGDTIRYPGLGDVGVQGKGAGDLYLTIRVLPHRQFSRHGDNVHTEVEIPLSIAVLGGTVQVPTLTDFIDMKIPSGTQTGTEFRLRGLGVPGRGDQYVKVILKTPTKLTGEEKRLWEELADQSS